MADGVTITWLGHGTFLYESPDNKRILVDPWIDGNPSFPDSLKDRVANVDVIAITHGHFDHVGSLTSLFQQGNAPVLCMFDLVAYLAKQGIAEDRCMGFNLGGTVEAAGVRFTMTPAFHSSSITDDSGNIIYLGNPAGYVLRFGDGTTIYHTGDTCVFGDMRLIGELYQPDAAVMPIGDWFTMGPDQAAMAAKLIGAPKVIPGHFGTFPALSGTPEALRQALGGQNVEVVELTPGSSTTISRSAARSAGL